MMWWRSDWSYLICTHSGVATATSITSFISCYGKIHTGVILLYWLTENELETALNEYTVLASMLQARTCGTVYGCTICTFQCQLKILSISEVSQPPLIVTAILRHKILLLTYLLIYLVFLTIIYLVSEQFD